MRTHTVSPARLAVRQFTAALVGVIAIYCLLYGVVWLVWAWFA
ncbi:hypothetical protein TPB0596_31940 [Tsukamurella pulmonis]|nr:hypothetical protein [Tsukamurella pulmonis]BDD83431.1 hypothetical protein TPB0596_31940 [Tsukamurella pulmonis]